MQEAHEFKVLWLCRRRDRAHSCNRASQAALGWLRVCGRDLHWQPCLAPGCSLGQQSTSYHPIPNLLVVTAQEAVVNADGQIHAALRHPSLSGALFGSLLILARVTRA